jgi:hypothetical protein
LGFSIWYANLRRDFCLKIIEQKLKIKILI